jgi:hypothetical protein
MWVSNSAEFRANSKSDETVPKERTIESCQQHGLFHFLLMFDNLSIRLRGGGDSGSLTRVFAIPDDLDKEEGKEGEDDP